MYYITKKDSETGMKLQALLDKKEVARQEIIKLKDKYGFENCREDAWSLFGGISSCRFKTKPNPRYWRKSGIPGEHYPSKRTKIGKGMVEEFENLPVVSRDDLCKAVGYTQRLFEHPGWSWSNDKYFGIKTNSESYTPPTDVEEVTRSRYRELFDSKK